MNRYDVYSPTEYAKPWELPFNELNTALASRQKKQDEDVANSDVLDNIFPKAGNVTALKLSKFKEDFTPQINELQKQVGEGKGNSFAIKQLARKIIQDPRYDYISDDYKTWKSPSDKAVSEGNFPDYIQNFYDPVTKTYNQVDPNDNTPLAQVYQSIAPAPYVEEYQKYGNLIKPISEKIKEIYPGLQSEELPDGRVVYYQTGETGQKKYIDKARLMEFLKPNGTYGDYITKAYQEKGLPGKTYRTAQQSKQNGIYSLDNFAEDVLDVNLPRIFDESAITPFANKINPGTGGDGGGSGVGGHLSLLTSEQPYGVSFTMDPEAKSYSGLQNKINNLNTEYEKLKTTELKNIQTKLNTTLGIPEGTVSVSVDEINGIPFVNSHVDKSTLTPEQQVAYVNFEKANIIPTNANLQASYNNKNAYRQLFDDLVESSGVKNVDKKVLEEADNIAKGTYAESFQNSTNVGMYSGGMSGVEIEDAKKKAKEASVTARNEYLKKFSPAYKKFYDELNSVTDLQLIPGTTYSISQFDTKNKQAAQGLLQYGLETLIQNPSVANFRYDNSPLGDKDRSNLNKILAEENLSDDKKQEKYSKYMYVRYDKGSQQYMLDVAIPGFEGEKYKEKLKNSTKGDVGLNVIEIPLSNSNSNLTGTNPRKLVMDLGIDSEERFNMISQLDAQVQNSFGHGELSIMGPNGPIIVKVKQDMFSSLADRNKVKVSIPLPGIKTQLEVSSLNNTSDAADLFRDLVAIETDIIPKMSSHTEAEQKIITETIAQNLSSKYGMTDNQIDILFSKRFANQLNQVQDNSISLNTVSGITVDPSVSNPTIDNDIKDNVQAIATKYPGMTITGATRDEATNTAVGGKVNSKHLVGKALDIRANDESKIMYEDLINATREELTQYGIDSIIIEKGNIPVIRWQDADHVHIEFK